MVTTNCAFLENEISDIVRLFPDQPNEITHRFDCEGDCFYNRFTVDGEVFSFEDRGQVRDEILFKRLERRFAKLHLYEILSKKYRLQMPWGALTGIRPTKLAYTEIEQGGDYKKLFLDMHVQEKNIRSHQSMFRS